MHVLFQHNEDPDPQPHAQVEAGEEESDVLHQHGDQSAQNPGPDGHPSVTLGRQDVLLQADHVHKHRAEYEACHKHHRFEEPVTCNNTTEE